MTTRQRNQFLTVHAVREMIRGMQDHRLEFTSNVRKSLDRIEKRASDVIDSYGTPTAADRAVFKSAANNLCHAWEAQDEQHTTSAFVSIALTLVADQLEHIPKKAKFARHDFEMLEGMLFTLYRHFDPDVEDLEASKAGESVAQEYRLLVAV